MIDKSALDLGWLVVLDSHIKEVEIGCVTNLGLILDSGAHQSYENHLGHGRQGSFSFSFLWVSRCSIPNS